MDITKIAGYAGPWDRLKCFLQNPDYSNIAAVSGLGQNFDWAAFREQLLGNATYWAEGRDALRLALDRMHNNDTPLNRRNQYLLCYALQLQRLKSEDEKQTDADARINAAMQLFTVGLGVHALSPRNLNEFILLCALASGLEYGDYAGILKTVSLEDQPNLPPFDSATQVAIPPLPSAGPADIPSYMMGNPAEDKSLTTTDPAYALKTGTSGTSILGSCVSIIAASKNPKESLVAFLEKNRSQLDEIFSKNRSTYYTVICGCQDPAAASPREAQLRYWSLFGLAAYCLDQDFACSALDEATIGKLTKLFPDTFISSGVFENYYGGKRNAEIYAGIYFLSILYGIESASLESEEDFRTYLNDQMITVSFPAPDFDHQPFDYLVLCAYRKFKEAYPDPDALLEDADSDDIVVDYFLNFLRESLVQVANSKE
jgi:hypothetical protein